MVEQMVTEEEALAAEIRRTIGRLNELRQKAHNMKIEIRISEEPIRQLGDLVPNYAVAIMKKL